MACSLHCLADPVARERPSRCTRRDTVELEWQELAGPIKTVSGPGSRDSSGTARSSRSRSASEDLPGSLGVESRSGRCTGRVWLGGDVCSAAAAATLSGRSSTFTEAVRSAVKPVARRSQATASGADGATSRRPTRRANDRCTATRSGASARMGRGLRRNKRRRGCVGVPHSLHHAVVMARRRPPRTTKALERFDSIPRRSTSNKLAPVTPAFVLTHQNTQCSSSSQTLTAACTGAQEVPSTASDGNTNLEILREYERRHCPRASSSAAAHALKARITRTAWRRPSPARQGRTRERRRG